MEINQKKRRIFNHRPICVCTLSAIFCLLAVNAILHSKAFEAVVYFVAIAVLLGYVAYKRKFVCVVFALVVSAVFAVYACVVVKHFSTNTYNDQTVNLTARVNRLVRDYGSARRYLMNDVKFGAEKQNFNVYLTIHDNTSVYEDIDSGTVLSCSVILETNKILRAQDIDYSTYGYNVKYDGSVYVDNIVILDQKPTIADKVRSVIKSRIYGAMSVENATLAYSALFGDKLELTHEFREAFSASGAAHLVAVSGLHVGLIVSIIAFVLGKLKVKPWVSFVVNFILIGLYAYLCNFAVSVCRAWLMTAVLLLAPLVKREYDTISSISLAGLILLAINPFEIFDPSALMSFGCVIGIAGFNKMFAKGLCKLRFPKFLVDSLSMSMSAQLGILGATMLFFNNISVISIVTNIIVIPLFTFAFSFVFCVAFIAIILPFVRYLLWLVNPVVSCVCFVCNWLGRLSFANISTNGISYLSYMICNSAVICASKYTMLKRADKIFSTLVVFTIFIVCATIGVLV